VRCGASQKRRNHSIRSGFFERIQRRF
jgi:hypothetical protein